MKLETRNLKLGKKKVLSIIASAILLSVSILIFDYFHISQDEILKKAIYLNELENNENYLTRLTLNIKSLIRTNFRKGKRKDLSKRVYSPYSFSYFFVFGGRRGDLEEKGYDLLGHSMLGLSEPYYDSIDSNESVLRINDITDQEWKWEGDDFYGSFSFETTYGVKGRCLFKGKNRRITKVVVAEQDSDKFEDGFPVFGCNSNHYFFAKPIYRGSIKLPKISEDECFAEKRPESGSLEISILPDGNIYYNRKKLEINTLKYILKESKEIYSNSNMCVYLIFDKNCPREISKKIIFLVKTYRFPTYQIFQSNEDKRIVVKEL